MNHPPLAIDVLDRCAEHRSDPDWLDAAWPRAQIVVCDPDADRIDADSAGLHYWDAETAPEGERIYLGGEEPAVFAVIAPVPDGLPTRWIGGAWDERDLAIAVEAIGVMHWRNAYRFHPATGEPLRARAAGWELAADSGRPVFPRTDPAVIVLIDDGADKALLAQHQRWAGPKSSSQPGSTRRGRYACIAGFVEPGESAEAAVHREVSEEIGFKLDRLEYVSSQPWPYPRSLMLAYRATADPSQELVLQADEIADARWFTREEVREMWVDTEEEIPSAIKISIARFLIGTWLDES
ncbi:NAD(+) diphosphatase [Glycomyces buryatensis]|uniref:NAD(+) diphosphatase n=1 Tax=Glycomyces buryatensis TaxID=2570927 RepID=A0A4S8QN10_9ACTN|nr:NAD(+) diphosphatase [Glycomyces buryatensis]THV42114.1 NAD(+) diphosphatase [Glycomyces buryatensis]